jgi:N-methylhydantoinase B
LDSKSTTQLTPNDVVSIQTPGGGGYGDPLEREPENVLEDVRNEKVSVRKASEEYGVVLTDDGTAVDEAATQERRQTLRESGASDGGEAE